MLDFRAQPFRAVGMLSAAAILMSTAAIRAQQQDPVLQRDGNTNSAACSRLGFS